MANDMPGLADTARAEVMRAAEEALAAPRPRPAARRRPRCCGACTPPCPPPNSPPTRPRRWPPPRPASSPSPPTAARGRPRCACCRPGPGTGPLPVAEIVTDDMPFLVDCVLAALALHGRAVRQLLHPILRGARATAPGACWRSTAPRRARESMMRVTLGAGAARCCSGGTRARPRRLAALEAALARAMADVRAATADFPAMLGAAARRRGRGRAPAARAEEAADFLRWLAEDNFVLLGHRRFALDAGRRRSRRGGGESRPAARRRRCRSSTRCATCPPCRPRCARRCRDSSR